MPSINCAAASLLQAGSFSRPVVIQAAVATQPAEAPAKVTAGSSGVSDQAVMCPKSNMQAAAVQFHVDHQCRPIIEALQCCMQGSLRCVGLFWDKGGGNMGSQCAAFCPCTI